MAKSRPKWGMLIDATKCVGCHACHIACQNQWELKVTETYNRIEEEEIGSFPNFNRRFLPVQCQHCDNPPCVRVCPVGASYKRKDGVVLVDPKRCIGCKYCIAACPYNVRIIREREGHIHKCRFCIEFVEQGGKPACATTCMMGVRVFGNLTDPASEISRLIARKRPVKYREDLNTKPSIYYVMS